jgi:hypothetical protein
MTAIHAPLLTYQHLHQTVLSHLDSVYEQDIQRCFVPARRHISTQLRYIQQRAHGDVILNRLTQCLDEFDMMRFPHQIEFHANFLETILPFIYGNDWRECRKRVLASLGLTKVRQECLVISPRRWGKTVSVAMFVAALLLCVPNVEVAIFSTGRRTAGKLMNLIIRMFLRHPLADKYHFKTHNQETVIMVGPDGGERALSCYPGSVKVTFQAYVSAASMCASAA